MKALNLEYKWLVGAVFAIAAFMEILDTTIIIVAIPTLAREFGVATTTIEWVVTGYLLSLAVVIPLSGWLGDRFGTRRMFLVAVAFFLAGSLLSGLAWNIESLIGFRVVQGIGGGMITPIGFAMLFRAFPPSEFATASAILTVPIMLAPALGPILGGYLVEHHDWRWIFYLNVPVGVIGFVAAAVLLREDIQETAGSLDWPGVVLSGAGLVAVVYALAEAGLHGFDDSRVLLFGLGGLALLAVFTRVELRTREPLIDVRLLGDKLFGVANVVQFLAVTGLMGSFFLLPILLQQQKGLGPLDAGLLMFPDAIGVAVIAIPASRLYTAIGPRRMLVIGGLGSMMAAVALSQIDYETSGWFVVATTFSWGISLGLMFVAIEPAAFTTIRPQGMGRASSIFNTGRQVASSLGVAILASVLTSRLAAHDAQLGVEATRDGALLAFEEAFLFAAALSVLGIVASLWIDDRKIAEATGHGETVDPTSDETLPEAAG